MSSNRFDDLDSGLELDPKEIERKQKELEAEYNQRDYLIHQVFEQNEQGKALLSKWMDIIIENPVIVKGENHDLLDIGINQGIQDFIRGLYLTCKKVKEA